MFDLFVSLVLPTFCLLSLLLQPFSLSFALLLAVKVVVVVVLLFLLILL